MFDSLAALLAEVVGAKDGVELLRDATDTSAPLLDTRAIGEAGLVDRAGEAFKLLLRTPGIPGRLMLAFCSPGDAMAADRRAAADTRSADR